MFRRKREEEPPDEFLTFLSVSEAENIRNLVRAPFAERGLEVTVFGDHVVDTDGRQFGLWNVAVACRNDDRGNKAWPNVIAKHVATILARTGTNPFKSLADSQLLERTYARVYEEASIPDADKWPRVQFADGVVVALALDLPEAVMAFQRADVDRFGGWQRLYDAGLANLRKLPVERLEKLDAPGAGQFHVLLGESVYTASRALLFPRLATELSGKPADDDNGWLLSMPNRHQVCWHAISDASAVAVLNGMTHFTRLGFADGAGPVSPHVYWWNGSGYNRLTSYDESGNPSIHVGPRFGEVLERLAANGR